MPTPSLKKAFRRFKTAVWTYRHNRLNAERRREVGQTDVTVISMNCTGGILYHDLGLEFRSPTVNLYMGAEDFVKFCENLEHYLSIDDFAECVDPAVVGGRTYPVARLGDLMLYLVHYESVPQAEEKWNRRKARVNFDNIAVVATDRDGMNDDLKDRFERLPYRKVMFVNRPDPKHPSCFYISGYEGGASVGIVTEHDTWDGTRPVDQFDWVSFMGQGQG